MSKKMNEKLSKMILVALVFTAALQASISNYMDAVDLAGLQRMRIVRMLKDSVLVATRNSYGNPKTELKKLIGTFEATMKDLQNFAKGDQSRQALSRVEKGWGDYRKILQSPMNVEAAEENLRRAIDLVQKEDRAVKALATEAGAGSKAEEIDRAGLLRMLSQKIGTIYLIRSWEGDRKNSSYLTENMNKVMHAFRSSLDFLKGSRYNTAETKRYLDKLEKIYFFFDIVNQPGSTYIPTLVVKKSNRMFENAVALVKAYKKQTVAATK